MESEERNELEAAAIEAELASLDAARKAVMAGLGITELRAVILDDEKAATVLQAGFRGMKARQEAARRREALEREIAATKLQAGFRGMQARAKLRERREQEAAAVKIQSTFRGHQVRKEHSFIAKSSSSSNDESNGRSMISRAFAK